MDEEEEGELYGHEEFSNVAQHSYLRERCVLVYVLSYKVAILSSLETSDM